MDRESALHAIELCALGVYNANHAEVLAAAKVLGAEQTVQLLTDYYRRELKRRERERKEQERARKRRRRKVYMPSGRDAMYRAVPGSFGTGKRR